MHIWFICWPDWHIATPVLDQRTANHAREGCHWNSDDAGRMQEDEKRVSHKQKGRLVSMRTSFVLLVVVLLVGMLVLPANAIKVYVNPSIQTSNYSPDGAYQEGSNMQDVASRLVSKLQGRGFEARNSGWLSLDAACVDSNNWGSNCFVALHTDATGGAWSSAHGSRGFFYQSSGGWHDDRCVNFAAAITNRMTQKFNAFGRGYNLGTQADYPWCGWNMYAIAPWNTAAMPATLIEGLFHTNWDDVYSVLLTTAGRDAYAQGVFEGICDYYGWSYTTGSKPRPCVSNNADGRLEVFARGRDGAMYTACVLTGGGWSSWINMGGSLRGDPCVARNQDGRMECFCVGTDGAIYHAYQTTANGTWSGWSSMGGNCPGNPTVAANSDGRLEVFVRGTDNRIYHQWQLSPNGSWNGSWQVLGTANCNYDPAAITDPSGNIHVFAIGTGGTMLECKETPTWTDFVGIGRDAQGNSWKSTPACGKNQDGRIEVFAIANDNTIQHRWQTSAGQGGYSGAATLGGSWTHAPQVFPDQNGCLQVFAVGSTTNLYTQYQTSPNGGWASGWANLQGQWGGDPGIGMNSDGRDEIFMVGNDPYMYHCWESAPNGAYGGWSTLGPNTIF